ncbi:mechanosensitive ion channel domain-containing protein [Nitratireductor sp. ZSWI3]|uniref:mechanosensitive ion channel domain-containing protein n=1 Tax=Nitratireductor sp. ZSWI3 TaxID=2966359 RepID=UPI00215056AB|nr:mechanosensitive ion channel domain-containing protein [Nitratireductor sp. ZSWI3]MCR4268486.1 mechanosensitive ion channel [Nitratireductor sp. ZSWI3]
MHGLASYVRDWVEQGTELIGLITRLSGQATAVLSGTSSIDLQRLWRSVQGVLLVVAVTFIAYFLLRLAFRRIQRVLAGAAKGSRLLRRIGTIALSASADAVTVLGAWAVGYLPALYFGWAGWRGDSQTLFLNAFLFIELAKVMARVLLAPRWPVLRLGRIDDTTAAYWYFWVSRLVSVIGYTFLFAAPLLAANVSGGIAEALRVFVLFCTLAMAWVIILQNRESVRARLLHYAERGQSEPFIRLLMSIATFWHIVAIGYLTLIFVLWLANREAALPFVLLATVQSIVAVAVGVLLTTAMVRLTAGGMHLPDDIKARLPLLEARINAFVPNVLRVIRYMIMTAVVLATAQIWRVADFIGWLSSEFGQRVVTSVLAAAFVLLVGGLIHLAVQSWVEYRLNPSYGHAPSPRERTLLALFRNAFTIALSIVVFLLVLAELGVNIAPLLAGAGIVGLAVGFGSQKLVQDVINGAFIQFESAMNEGDVVTVGGITGAVERLTIRSVSLRSVDGAYHLIPFSSVDSVTNFMRNFSYHVAAIGVDYQENISEVKRAMQEAFERLQKTEYGEDIIGDMEMHGVTEFADSAVIVRARIKTVVGRQFALGRAYNEIIKEVFDERGISIPFPHVTLHLPAGKQDAAPPTSTRARQKNSGGAAKTRPKRRRRPEIAANESTHDGADSLDEMQA